MSTQASRTHGEDSTKGWRRSAVGTAAAALVAAVTLTGCGFGGSSSDSAVPRSEGATAQGEGGAAEDSSVADDQDASRPATGAKGATGARSQQRTVVSQQRLARSATLDLTVADVDQAAAKVRSAAARVDGAVTSEEVSSDEGHAWGEVVVTVPSSRLDTTLDALSELGTVERRTTSTSDESSTYTDTASRIKTMRASIARVQRLIASTDDIDQLVTLESDLSTRQADLESLLAQLKDLERRTSTSPVTVSLSQEGAPEREDEDATGFVAGLSAGWDAFGSSAAVLLTVLGALTPFAALGLLVTAPLVWWWRRRRVSAPLVPAAGGPARRHG